MTPAEERSAVAHLLRRVGFGSPPAEVDAYAALGYEGAVDALCDFDASDPPAEAIAPPQFDTAGYLASLDADPQTRQAAQERAREERIALIGWWLRRMVASERPLREKLTFWWHDHFATSLEKVDLAELMYRQHGTLHRLGPGRFDDLVRAMAVDPAMLIWLDGRDSTVRAPNENFARELFELFTLGHGGGHHDQPYTEADVAEAARALTGWVIDGSGTGVLVAGRHDAGVKTVLGTTGDLGLDEVVDIVVAHPASAPHVVSRLWSRVGRPAAPDDPVVQELAVPFAEDRDTAALLRRMLLHPEFLAPASRTALVKTPVEFLVGTARILGRELDVGVGRALVGLGQVPFRPPDVSGWPANEAWISTASALIRLELAVRLVDGADLSAVSDAPTADRPAAAAHLLGIDAWGPGTEAALVAVADDPAELMVGALVSPEHLHA